MRRLRNEVGIGNVGVEFENQWLILVRQTMNYRKLTQSTEYC